ncbi:MAG: phosphoethanolamine transferase [Candidatus Riflebacteria bacterium]|nr:phosphoethanolamine transferase [Candidatus Riflebacteria bacterium]
MKHNGQYSEEPFAGTSSVNKLSNSSADVDNLGLSEHKETAKEPEQQKKPSSSKDEKPKDFLTGFAKTLSQMFGEGMPLIFVTAFSALVPYLFLASYVNFLVVFLAVMLFVLGMGVGGFFAVCRYLLFYKPFKLLFDCSVFFLTAFLAFIGSLTAYKMNSMLSTSYINSALGANVTSIKGFASMYLGMEAFFVCLIFFLATALLWRLGRKYGEAFLRSEHRKGRIISFLLFSVLTFFFIPSGLVPVQTFLETVVHSFLIDVKLNKLREEKGYAADIKSNFSEIPYIVLILGESESSYYMSQYGYPLKTTPVRDRLEEEGSLHVFYDAVAPYAMTWTTVPMLITSIANDKPEFKEENAENLVDIFSKAGYKTFWLSNADHHTVASAYITFVATEMTDFCHFTSDSMSMAYTHQCFDGELLKPLKETIASNLDEPKQFYTIHFMGSHYAYDLRYPPEFERFKPEDLDIHKKFGLREIEQKKRPIVAAYLNSILYSDYVVGEIIKLFEDKNVIVVYLSDHADEIGQNGKYTTHTHMGHSKSMLRVPMFIWMSETFEKSFPELAERVKNPEYRKRPFITEDLFHTMLDLAGIETAQSDFTKSILSPDFKNKPRIIRGNLFENLPD